MNGITSMSFPSIAEEIKVSLDNSSFGLIVIRTGISYYITAIISKTDSGCGAMNESDFRFGVTYL